MSTPYERPRRGAQSTNAGLPAKPPYIPLQLSVQVYTG
jgi:hypothetical protein